MSDAKRLLAQRAQETLKATRLFFQAVTGESRAAGKRLAVDAVRERGRGDLAQIIDAEFEVTTARLRDDRGRDDDQTRIIDVDFEEEKKP